MNSLIKIIIICLLFLSISTHAQRGNNPRVEALRTEFISKRLNLTSSEAEKFWPVYNEYNDKIHAIRKNLRQNYRNADNLTDAQANELYLLEQQSRQAELDVHKQYSERLKTIVGTRRMVNLRIAEEDFKKEVLKVIKERND